MKNSMLAVLVAGFLLLAPSVRGGLVDGLDIELGTEIGEFHYRESHFMREDGPQYGGYLSLALRPDHPGALRELERISAEDAPTTASGAAAPVEERGADPPTGANDDRSGGPAGSAATQ